MVVCILALAMAIPAIFVGGLVDDRTTRAAEVVRQISGYNGGQQPFRGSDTCGAVPQPPRPHGPFSISSRGIRVAISE